MGLNKQKSAELFEAAKKMFPGGVHSPVRAFKSVYGPPLFIDRGESCYLYDVDGNQFIDFCNSWGPLILGHKHKNVIKAVKDAIDKGLTFGAPNAISNQLGQIILDNHRFIEKIRFVSSGTEAVMSAIRLARGYTGKDKIIKFEGCYHGHVDSLMVQAGSGLATFGTSTSAGIPESFIKDTLVLPLGDLDLVEKTLQKVSDSVAAIIIEPIPANNGLLIQDLEYHQGLRELCYKYGVLLIWDEVISGFRIGFEGAAGYYNVQPDIITFGKIIGGGMPVGAYAASSEIMKSVAPDGPVYQAGTLSANPISMAAGLATLQTCLEDGFYEDLEQKKDLLTQTVIKEIGNSDLALHFQSIGSIFWLTFSNNRIFRADQIEKSTMDLYKELHKYLLDHGIYWGPSGYEVGFISSAHSAEIIKEAAKTISTGILQLKTPI